jgi:hypothetical protein
MPVSPTTAEAEERNTTVMDDLSDVAFAFVEMAHRIVWCAAATVDGAGRPRSRILHPIWEWDGERLVGWVATTPTPMKRAHLRRRPHLSCTYYDAAAYDSCVAECGADWALDDRTCERVWGLFERASPPLGYDPGAVGVPGWDAPTSPDFTALRLTPWRLHVLPGAVLRTVGGPGALVWRKG